MADYDSPWKEALDLFFEAFSQLFFPEAHADIDWGRPYESLDKELQQIAPEAEIGRRYVDKLVKVWQERGGTVGIDPRRGADDRRGRFSLADVRLQLPHLRHV